MTGQDTLVAATEGEPEQAAPAAVQRRRLGALVGQVQVPADFDAALPETVLDGFEGS